MVAIGRRFAIDVVGGCGYQRLIEGDRQNEVHPVISHIPECNGHGVDRLPLDVELPIL